MKVTKAIELLQRKRQTEPGGDLGEDWDAINLGVEALRRHRSRDYITYNQMHELLPGETPEEEG